MESLLHIPQKTRINFGAFRGKLECPHMINGGICGANSWKYIEQITPTRIRYQCKKCKRTIQYDFSHNDDFLRKHPYEPFKSKPLFKRVIDNWKLKQKTITIK